MQVTLSDIQERLPYARAYGHYLSGLCPFHSDRRPSLIVSAKRYRCKSCGATGPLSKLYKKLNPSDPRLYKPHPPRFGGRPLPSYNNIHALRERLMDAHDTLILDETMTRGAWYEKRGISRTDQLIYELGWYENWYTVPVFGENGDIIGGVARANPQLEAKKVDKYYVPLDQPSMLYIPNWTNWRKCDKVFIAFGIFDAISLAILGYAAASPTAGQDSTDPRWLDNVRKPIYVVPDDGERTAALDLVRKLGFRGRILRLPYSQYECKDPNDFLQKGLSDELTAYIKDNTHEPRGIE